MSELEKVAIVTAAGIAAGLIGWLWGPHFWDQQNDPNPSVLTFSWIGQGVMRMVSRRVSGFVVSIWFATVVVACLTYWFAR